MENSSNSDEFSQNQAKLALSVKLDEITGNINGLKNSPRTIREPHPVTRDGLTTASRCLIIAVYMLKQLRMLLRRALANDNWEGD